MITKNLKIHHSNWTTSYLKNEDLKAFVSLVAEPSEDFQSVVNFYSVTLTNRDGEELFQELFLQLETALNELETKYSDWKLVEMAKTLSEGEGCSSCAAH